MIQKHIYRELEEQEDMGSLHWLCYWNMEEVINKYADKEILEYQKTTTICRGDFLFRDIDGYKHNDLGF